MAEGLDRMKVAVMGLIMAALIIAALAVALDAFQSDVQQCDGTLWHNATDDACYTNSSLSNTVVASAYSAERNVTDEGLLGVGNASSYLSTIGTLVGVAALVAVVMVAFVFVRR